MTEEKLDQKRPKASKGRIAGLFLALFGILVLALWLLRQPIAEMVARNVCEGEGLSCRLSVTRLDLGGVSLTNVDARAPGSMEPAVAAREIVIDLTWDGLFSPRPVSVSGDEIALRLDLTGRRSVFGDLDRAIQTFTKPTGAPPAPMPRLQISNISVIGETLSGPVTAKGRIVAEGEKAFVVEMDVPPSSLGLSGATLDLSAASLRARVEGEDLSAAVKLNLTRFAAQGVSLSDIVVDATVTQSNGALRGEGAARLGAVVLPDGKVANASAEALLESPPLGGEGFTLATWLANVRQLKLTATTGAGAFAGVDWKTSNVALNLGGGSAGKVSLSAENLHTPQASAARVDVSGDITVNGDRIDIINGIAKTTSGMFSSQQRAALGEAAAGVLESVLPSFGNALRGAIDRAGQSFAVSSPWSARIARDNIFVSLLSGAELTSASGVKLTAVAAEEGAAVGTFNSSTAEWTGKGRLTLQGGGAPPLTVNVANAAGGGDSLALSGTVSLGSWKVGNDSLSAEFAGLDLATKGAEGAAAGSVVIRLDGGLAGGAWTNARATGEVSSRWDAQSFSADAPKGAVIQWDKAIYAGSTFGAAALRYMPEGRLAERSGDGMVGRGRLEAISIPVSGDAFSADVSLGATAIGWRTAGGFRANFDAAPAAVDLRLQDRAIPIRIPDIAGEVDLRRGWKVLGRLTGATVETAEGHVADLGGAFDLSGSGNNLSGSISGLSMRLFDPLEEGKRYEEVKFRGEAHLNNNDADFTGTFTMAASGMQVAHVTGRHNLESGNGGLSFEPTPLIFRPRQFQPADLSPMLLGPANVTGRLDVGGEASWTPDAFKASGVLDMKKLGFALASAGVFEGVSGRVEVADLLNMQSAPGQRITIDKVTFGLPIEKGEIEFRLMGYDAIHLEGARFPFAGGFIRVDPDIFTFSSTAENRIVARADNWDLAVLAEQLKIPDTKLAGVVAGRFPVVFRTGSAEIDNATLKSVKPGVIQYSGSTGDAAAQADENSKMLFDALKDFQYEVLEVGLDGNLTGRMMVTLGVLGRNPDVLGGQPFRLNIGIDSALVPLLTSTFQSPDIRTAIEQAQEDRK